MVRRKWNKQKTPRLVIKHYFESFQNFVKKETGSLHSHILGAKGYLKENTCNELAMAKM